MGIEEISSEEAFQVSGDLTSLESVEIRKMDTGIDPSGGPLEMNYDFAVGSSGAAGPVDVDVNHRGLNVGPFVTAPITVTDFFTSIANTGKLHAVQRLLRNGQISYDMFFTNEGTGAIDAELIYQQLIVPPGELPAVIPTTAAVIDVVTVFREWRGSYKVYDVFVLEGV